MDFWFPKLKSLSYLYIYIHEPIPRYCNTLPVSAHPVRRSADKTVRRGDQKQFGVLSRHENIISDLPALEVLVPGLGRVQASRHYVWRGRLPASGRSGEASSGDDKIEMTCGCQIGMTCGCQIMLEEKGVVEFIVSTGSHLLPVQRLDPSKGMDSVRGCPKARGQS
jgi:hypothetical protein